MKSIRLLILSLVVVAALTQHLDAGVIYVNASATGANSGTNWTDAFTDLQDALAAANPGDEIWVADGTYMPDGGRTPTSSPHANGTGNRIATFQLLDGVAIYGGFAGGESMLSQRDISANLTILSGDLAGDDAPVACTANSPDCDSFGYLCVASICIIGNNNAENSYHVLTGTGTDNTAVLNGFTITAGNADADTPDERGAGMYNDAGSPTVTNCTFSNNSTRPTGGGAGMFNGNGSNPTMTNCIFTGNSANAGGAMHNDNESSPTLTNCTFIANSANFPGGGMYNEHSSNPTLTDCTFSQNSAGAGGGMYNAASSPNATNCTLSGNSAGFGGGMYNTSSSPTVTNCTFSGNSANSNGGGMLNESGSNPTVTHCTFSGNSAGNGGGMGNSSSNPVVTDSTFTENLTDDGGGMYNYVSNPMVTNCAFSANSTNVSGGGMYNTTGSDPTVTNCTFSGNSAGHYGGGMFVHSSGSTLINCTFSGNSASFDGGGMEVRNLATPTVCNSILWGNVDDANGDAGGPFVDESAQIHIASGTLGITYSIVDAWSGAFGGAGNSGDDPHLAADLRPEPGSPAINTGNNDCVTVLEDLAGNQRIVECVVDMGAYEFGSGPCLPADVACRDCNANGVPDVCDIANCTPNDFTCSDCNANSIPDVCEPQCNTNADCNDMLACTCDRCVCGVCLHQPIVYADANCDCTPPNLDDILCVLRGFESFAYCSAADIHPPCTGDADIDLDDILAVLSAFGGTNPCLQVCNVICPTGACCRGMDCAQSSQVGCLAPQAPQTSGTFRGEGTLCPPLGPVCP